MVDELISGFHRFRGGYYKENRDRFLTLANAGQSPKVAIISCCDSRVNPELITDCNPGDLFIIRNVANLVPPCENGKGIWHGTSAAMQYAVNVLEIKHIIVLGHAGCGGIASLMSDEPLSDDQGEFINKWMRIVEPCKSEILSRSGLLSDEEKARACELGAIKVSLENLMTFPWIENAVDSSLLKLHGWYYDIESGALLSVNPQGEFLPV